MSADKWPVRAQARPVSMKLFGAWEVDKTPANCIPRLCTVTITRLMLTESFPSEVSSLVLAVRMQGSKRILRSNEITLSASSEQLPSGERAEVSLDLTFALQYPHFLKKNSNQMQVLLQRRKRYKNRAMLGFKTLAGGIINMAEVLQRSHHMKKELELRENSKDVRKSEVLGRILMSSLKSQPVDHDTSAGRSLKMSLNESADVESDEDVDDFSGSDGSDSEPVDETGADGQAVVRTKWRASRNHSRSKKPNSHRTGSLDNPNAHHQRNLKQKFIALLKKFKIPDSEASDSEEQVALENELMANASVGNIDDIFEFEDSDADSAQDFDDFSVSSTPRPGLKPFFSSKTTLVEENEEVAKRISGQSSEDRDYPLTSSPKPSLRPFFSSKSTLTSREAEERRVDPDPQDSSGTEHTPDTSDTSMKQSFGDTKCNNDKDKKMKQSSKDQTKASGSGSKNVKETISRLLRK